MAAGFLGPTGRLPDKVRVNLFGTVRSPHYPHFEEMCQWDLILAQNDFLCTEILEKLLVIEDDKLIFIVQQRLKNPHMNES